MTMPFTDHHLQDTIITALVVGEQRFSDLIPDSIENSLFMYHMRKLIKEGLVEKDDQMYRLTLKGAQFYNARYQLKQPLHHPRTLIQFVVVKNDSILLSKRTTSLSKTLNKYMLPGGIHYFMAPSRASANAIAKSRKLEIGAFLGSLETIARKSDYHGLIDLYEATYMDIKKEQPEHEFEWLLLKDVAAMDFDEAGSASHIAKRLLEDDLLPRMTWVVE